MGSGTHLDIVSLIYPGLPGINIRAVLRPVVVSAKPPLFICLALEGT